MKHFIDPTTNTVYAYAADGSQDAYIKEGLTPLSDDDLATLRASAQPGIDDSAKYAAWKEACLSTFLDLIAQYKYGEIGTLTFQQVLDAMPSEDDV